MVAANYACAYKEVVEILKYTEREDVNKIPRSTILMFKYLMDETHQFKVNINKSLQEQNLCREAKAILANIFKNYWATDEERAEMEREERLYLEQEEMAKREKYNPDDLFKNRKMVINDTIEEEQISMVEYKKEPFFIKILNKIKSIWERIDWRS